MTEPWSGCIDCGHAAHPFVGNLDVRCNVPTNTGDPANGPEYCECVQWADVLAAYEAIRAGGPFGTHEPGEHHRYGAAVCSVCGVTGMVTISIEPQRA